MSVELQDQRKVYTGNGVTDTFAFPFTLEDGSQVKVVVANASGVETTLTYGTDYTVTFDEQPAGIVQSTGSVVLSGPLTDGYKIALISNIPEDQQRTFPDNTPYYQEQVEGGIDKNTRLIQQISEKVERSVKLPATSSKTPEQFANDMFTARDTAVSAASDAAAKASDANDSAIAAAASAAQAATIANNSMITATGSTTARALADRFSDVINVKDYGAKGDGVTDDTAAWTAWQTALADGGIGYIPAGSYLVSGTVRHFVEGCFGNGQNWTMTGNPAPDDSHFMSNITETGPIIQHHRDFTGINSWSPLIDLSFESTTTQNWPWTTNGAGAQGIQVRGTIKGTGNAHPNGIRSLMLSELNGDGDAVAIWGRVYKNDPVGGTNDSDSCAIHARCQNNSTGSGLVMATEHWSCPTVDVGDEDSNHTMIPDGASVCQHVKAFSADGMTHSGILIAGGNADTYPYGMWNAITIGRSCFFNNGTNMGVTNTTAINCWGWFHDLGYPDIGIAFGYCPSHIKMTGAYTFNISADKTKIVNSTTSGNVSLELDKATGSDGTEGIGLSLAGDAMADWYVDNASGNVFYRSLKPSCSHSFWVKKSDNTTAVSFVVKETTVYARHNAVSLGDSSHRWTEVFASTGTINTSDERMKQDIEPIPDAVFRAWGKVNFVQFKFKDAVEKKGENARLHVGVIAQRIIEAFESEGVDAFRYGLLCYDEWDATEAQYEHIKVVDKEETHNEDGTVKEPEEYHFEDRLLEPAHPAGNMYSVRYEECLALECAYQRWMMQKLTQRIAILEE